MTQEVHMTATEMARLSDWLKLKGMTAEDAIECIHFIANGDLPNENGKKFRLPIPQITIWKPEPF